MTTAVAISHAVASPSLTVSAAGGECLGCKEGGASSGQQTATAPAEAGVPGGS